MKIRGDASPEQVTEELFQRAAELWSEERAQELRTDLARMAHHIWTLSANIPEAEAEPGFFISGGEQWNPMS